MASLRPRLEAIFREKFSPSVLEVIDESEDHAGHAGARSGGGHYRATIVSEAFAGQSRVARHQMVYATVNDLIDSGAVHALALVTRTADEWAKGLR